MRNTHNNNIKLLALFAFLLSFSVKTKAIDLPSFTSPEIINYSRHDYNAETQNWCILQDEKNIMWFGNHGKALWFDGQEWGSVSISNNSIIRSMTLLSNNKIMIGAFEEFGTIENTSLGNYTFQSWIDLIPEKHKNFSDVWKIHELNNTIYIQTNEKILSFKDGAFTGAIEPTNKFQFSFISNGRLYVEDVGSGLKVLLNSGFSLVEKGDFFKNKEIWFVGHSNGQLMVATQNQGAYIFKDGQWKKWDTEANQFITKNQLFSAQQLEDSGYIFGTVQNGVIIVNSKGVIEKRINIKNGLQNNTVLSLYQDYQKNLWMGLDRGISYAKINYPFSTVFSQRGFGTGYASIVFNKRIYFGTNQGVFTWSDRQKDFVLISNTAGQVWNLQVINNELYCCHNNGIFLIRDFTGKMLFPINGVWKIEKYPNSVDTYLAGTYTGLYKLELGNFKDAKRIYGINESFRVFEIDEDRNIWMSHGYQGVYRVKLKPDLNSVDQIMYFGPYQGLPSKINNELFKFRNEIIIAAEDGFYKYNDIIGLMQKYDKWNNMLPLTHPVSKIIKDQWDRYYFYNNSKISWATFNEDSLSFIDSTAFLALRNNFFQSFENIYFLSQDKAIIGTVDGFSIYNRNTPFFHGENIPFHIKRIYSYKNMNGNFTPENHNPVNNTITIPGKLNQIYIDISLPIYQSVENIQLFYSLNGGKHEKINSYHLVLQDLHDGKHFLQLYAKNLSTGKTTSGEEITFIILPPWYKRWYAILCYAVIFISLTFFAYILIRKNTEKVKQKEIVKQTKKMEAQQKELREQAEKAEKELIIMKNDKLSGEIRQKSEEIANSTMELVHKNKMLLEVKEVLSDIQKEKDIDIRNSRIKSMLKKIDRDLNNEENWRVFEKNFDEVHENFLNRLKEKHPGLTSKDLRLCAYLKMNLSSKEIAPLLRISVRSVEISRYRLRKKLNLSHETNLSDYILLF